MPRKQNIHFEISERKILLRIFDVFWVLFTLYLVGIFSSFEYFNINSDFWTWGVVLAIYLTVFSSVFELYDLQKASKFDTVLKNVILTTSVTVLFFLLTPFLTPVLPENRLQILYFFISIVSALLLWRFAYITLISSPRFYKRVLIINDSFDVDVIASQLQQSDPHYNIIGYINSGDYSGGKSVFQSGLLRFSDEKLTNIVKENTITEILISGDHTRSGLNEELLGLLKSGFPVKDYYEVYEEKTGRIPVQHIEKDFYKFFYFSKINDNKFYIFSHRFMDVVIASLGMIVGFLLVPFILVGNFLGNRGSLIYRQERVGRNGEHFHILKFRTMGYDAEQNGAQWAQKNDVRVTKFGKFLRRARLDEFPQFYNIFMGEMSLIGPRPERPVFVEELSEMIPFYDTRHVIKPGLTGWAQVMAEYGNSHGDSLEKLQYDLYYIKHRNLFLDINILVKTLSTIIFFRGQ
jgi:exopolysaccharide biosynthesis polyprenyl glycosylphosphotransferase